MLRIEHKFNNPFNETYVHRLKQNMTYEMGLFSNKLLRRIKKEISTGNFAANNPFWQQAKGGKKVLYNTGYMSQQVKKSVRMGSGNEFCSVNVGFLDLNIHPSGTIGIRKLVDWLSKDNQWTPTDKQRKAFWARIQAALGRRITPEEITKKDMWESPSRDIFAFYSFEASMWEQERFKHMRNAINKTFSIPGKKS